MKIIEQKLDNYLILKIQGELDASSSITLDNALERAIQSNTENILVDCAELAYISSPGIGVFTSHLDECMTRDIAIVLFNTIPSVRKVFSILGLDAIIPIVSSEKEAKSIADGKTHSNTMS
ncbi:MAG: STAS domain-containing protein [Bernardetiaceae bacterium]|nr:STAS domain-containing protein [Bernardetiaceae bacterium]